MLACRDAVSLIAWSERWKTAHGAHEHGGQATTLTLAALGRGTGRIRLAGLVPAVPTR
jgi:hypothetical protein